MTLFLLMGLLAGCAVPPAAQVDAVDPLPTPVAGEISVVNPAARTVPVAGGNGAIYFVITNGRDEVIRLSGAASPTAEVVEIHETVEDDGVMRMVYRAEGFEIEPVSALEFRPGGKHIMLIGVEDVLGAGDSLPLTLIFETSDGTVDVMELVVPVVDSESLGMPANAHDHDAHDHDAHDHDAHDHDAHDHDAHDHDAHDHDVHEQDD